MEESSTYYLDSNLLINAAGNDESVGDKARTIILAVQNKVFTGITSCLTIDEMAWVLRRKNSGYIEICEAFLNLNIRFLDVNKNIVLTSLDIIKEFNLKPRDAIHTATMKAHNIKNLISEDKDFDKIEWIKRTGIKKFKI